MSVLNGDQRVQILAGRKNLAGRLGSVELATVALDGRQLSVELSRDVHHERRLDRILAIGQRVQHLVRAVGGASAVIARQSGQVTGVASKLGRNAVIRVAADGEGKYHHARREVTYLGDDKTPRLIRVLKVGVGQSGVPALADSEDLRRPFGFLRAQLGTASGAAFSGCQIQYSGPITGIDGLEQGAGAGELDVVTMGGDGQDVDRHEGNKA